MYSNVLGKKIQAKTEVRVTDVPELKQFSHTLSFLPSPP